MFNKGGITKQTLTAPEQILFNVDLQASVGVVVNQSAGDTIDGKKIVKAGTPLSGDLTKRTTAFTKATGGNAVGVALHDIDVTNGNANGTLLIFGFVNLDRLSSQATTALTTNEKEALEGKIYFLTDVDAE